MVILFIYCVFYFNVFQGMDLFIMYLVFDIGYLLSGYSVIKFI